jgi:hypothetical protein
MAEGREIYEDFYIDLTKSYSLYTDVLVLDELLYVSHKKYRVPIEVTLEFVESLVLPYVTILPLGEVEYRHAVDALKCYELKPSDALHVGAMKSAGISLITTEDKDFERVEGLRRLWL